MKKTSVILATFAILLSIMTISCKKENSPLFENPSNEFVKQPNDPQKPESDSLKLGTVGGVKFLSESAYNALPKAKIAEISSLKGNDKLQTRAGYVKLSTPPVGDQGREGSCTAFAAGYGALSYFMNVVEGMPYTTTGALRSPEMLYNTTKLSNDCVNAGSYITTVLSALTNTGTCSWNDMPYNTYDCMAQPNGYQQQAAARARMSGYWTIPATDVKHYLSYGYPIIMGFAVDNNFDIQTGRYPFTYTSKGGDVRGGHAVMIVGYDDNRNAYIVQNSWGARHDGGFFYVDYNLFPSIAYELYLPLPQATQTAYKHTSSGSNNVNNWTVLDNHLSNNNPNALVFTTADYGTAGPYHDKSVGVWYDGKRWSIFNQDLTTMGATAKFNTLVVNPSSNAFVHTASTSTISGHITFINHPALNNNPNAKFIVEQRWEGVYNKNPVGVYYTGGQWAIYNQNYAAMPANAKFNILVRSDVFEVTATAPTNNWYFFSNPATTNRPGALVFATQYWRGVYNANNIGVWYSGGNWSVYNQSRNALPVNSKFFVLSL